jgi:hypothetical protein
VLPGYWLFELIHGPVGSCHVVVCMTDMALTWCVNFAGGSVAQ